MDLFYSIAFLTEGSFEYVQFNFENVLVADSLIISLRSNQECLNPEVAGASPN
jgi:hypothetical protein